MTYNHAPKYYWCCAIEYFCYTFNCMPRYDSNKSRIENVSETKSDVSDFIPFYAKGATYITRKQRQQHGGIVFATIAQSCRMLGYVQILKT
jgi:hypothetical protein